jgi:hypothetical protein
VFFQAIQMCRPEPAVGRQPRIELGQWLWPDAVQAALSVRTRLDHSRFPEHPKVLRHGRLAQVELIHELSYRSLPIAEQVEDGLSAGLRENLEGRQGRHWQSVFHTRYISVKAY